MATTFTWTISQLECIPQTPEGPDYVVTAYWSCTGTDGDYSSNIYGTCSFSSTQESTFVPYDELTQDQVLGWCWTNGVDKDATESAVQQRIDNQINPPIVYPPLPWQSQE